MAWLSFGHKNKWQYYYHLVFILGSEFSKFGFFEAVWCIDTFYSILKFQESMHICAIFQRYTHLILKIVDYYGI